jgi:hypothetical protein
MQLDRKTLDAGQDLAGMMILIAVIPAPAPRSGEFFTGIQKYQLKMDAG